ncbi:MAG TPA: hypothetical protein VL098_01160 [Flavipsychrobacter sp.]|nr:hypothetical protein [Flavipsychrobacter sp.]
MKHFFIILFSCSFFLGKISAVHAQDLPRMEDSLITTADSMYNAFIPEMRQQYCEMFVKQLVRALKTPNSYNYPFSKLDTVINIIQPEDKSFRIFNWAVAISHINIRYYGAIQLQGEQLKLYPLIDHSNELTHGIEDSILTNTNWYGAIYYEIITKEVNGKKIYSMIGKNAASITSNIKLIDPMQLTDKGAVFGAAIFNKAGKKINRFVLEYRKDVNVSMKWDNEYHAITFDRLISQMNDPNRKNTFVPTGQYDGFRWENEKWTLVEDIIPVQVFKDGEAPIVQPVAPKE